MVSIKAHALAKLKVRLSTLPLLLAGLGSPPQHRGLITIRYAEYVSEFLYVFLKLTLPLRVRCTMLRFLLLLIAIPLLRSSLMHAISTPLSSGQNILRTGLKTFAGRKVLQRKCLREF